MEAKHTAGPWRAVQRATYSEPGWSIFWGDTSKGGIHHRRLDSNGGFVESDARLIAAAPDLLAALKTLADRIDYYAALGAAGEPNIEDWSYTAGSSDMSAARAAIAKATGAA